jgi:hypothetical protein
MDIREIEWGCMDWIVLAQDKEHGTEPSGFITFLEVLE